VDRDPRVNRGLPARLRLNHGPGTGLGSGPVVRPMEFTNEEEGYTRATYSDKTSAPALETPKVAIPPQYADYKDVFEKKEFDKLPDRRPWDHAINLLPGAEQDLKLRGKIYPMYQKEQIELDKFIDENLASGRIRKSNSPVAAPFFYVPQKDGSSRLTQDYRRINAATVKDSWPLSVISDVMNRIQDAKYFSKFDVRWGFNNVCIKEGDEWKAAFICDRGLFKPIVMFFRLCNLPATF